jgi:predicted anti-sigma-YlaC factor YlaD
MKHQQFENWILQDETLTQPNLRELQAHLKQCSQCLALYQATTQISHLFNSTPAPEPHADFSLRWMRRLEIAERRKNQLILGATLSVISIATAILLASVGFRINTVMANLPQMMLEMVTMLANWIVFFNQLSNIAAPIFRVGVKLISPVWFYTIGISISGITAAWIIALSRSRTLQKELQS